MVTINPELVSNSDLCRNFPTKPALSLGRDNLYEEAEKAFLTTDIIFIEGDSLSGKSEFAAEYVRRKSNSSLAVFLSPDRAMFYSTEFVRLSLGEQIFFLINGVTFQGDEIDEQLFKKLIFQLQRRYKTKKVTFVIDGLVEAEIFDFRITQEIISLLPFGQNEFNFIITGSLKVFPLLNVGKNKPKTIPLMAISFDESKAYFSDQPQLNNAEVHKIRKFCGGTIGHLEKVKSFIIDGVEVDELLSGNTGTLTDIFEFEWQRQNKTETLYKILSFLTFSRTLITVNLLNELIEMPGNDIISAIKNCRMLELDVDSGIVSLRSEAQKQFLAGKLIDFKDAIQEAFISQLMRTPLSRDATVNLPTHLYEANKHNDIIQHLDSDHFVRLLKSEGSLKALQLHARYGLIAAKKSKDFGTELRFALFNSTLTNLTFHCGIRYEIESLFKLGKHEEAMELASMVTTNEEKLKLLAAVANCFVSNNLEVPSTLKNDITTLAENDSCDLSGSFAVEIATDLVEVDLRLAIQIFENASQISSHLIIDNDSSRNLSAERDKNKAKTNATEPTEKIAKK